MKKILLIEDNEILVHLMRVVLMKEGFLVEACTTGKSALEAIKTNRYDLFIVDILLPHYNGFEIIEQIKISQFNSDSPIIIASDIQDENYVKTGFDLGIDDFLKKPVSPVELIARVIRILGKEKSIL